MQKLTIKQISQKIIFMYRTKGAVGANSRPLRKKQEENKQTIAQALRKHL